MPIHNFAEISTNSAKLNNQVLEVKIYAIIQDIQVKGNLFCLTLYDLSSIFKLVISHEFYQKNKAVLLIHQTVLFHLLARIDDYKVQNIKIEKVEK